MGDYQHIVDECVLIPGGKGIFDVKANGELVYSKHATGRHANDGEVVELFAKLVGEDVPRFND